MPSDPASQPDAKSVSSQDPAERTNPNNLGGFYESSFELRRGLQVTESSDLSLLETWARALREFRGLARH